jgi:lysyl-tRNA synthetase class II
MATRIPEFTEIIEQNDQTEARSEHLDALRALVGNAYPNKFVRSTLSGGEDTITAILDHGPVADIACEMAEVRSKLAERERPPAEIKDALNERLKALGNVRIAGRLTTPPRGNFVHLTDGRNKLQIYAKKGAFALVKNDGLDTLDEENAWDAWQLIDHGDFVGVEGYLFITNTGEVSVHVEKLQFLAKAMLPMPDKMHGIADAEIRQRQRYYDLIGSSLQVEHEGLTTREVFERRAQLVRTSPLSRGSRLHRGRDADAHAEGDRCGGHAVRDASQRARHHALRTHRARALPQAARRRRL